MSEPFIGEIRLMGFDWNPRGWAKCDGALQPINQNQSLYSLLGTMYGGDGKTTFALPDLRGRACVGTGDHQPGYKFGSNYHTLSISEMPAHTHGFTALQELPDAYGPNDKLLAAPTDPIYSNDTNNLTLLHDDALSNTGNGRPHENMQPLLPLNYCIAMRGLYPSRN